MPRAALSAFSSDRPTTSRPSSGRLPFAVVGLIVLLILAGCAVSPTGRRQVILMSPLEMSQMGETAFAQMKESQPRSTDSARTAYVQCVAQAIIAELTPAELRPVAIASWEVELFADRTANAFALPGGKMGVHTGLLRVATTPDQLAAVLGHEVAHVLAQHGNERVSQSTLAESGMAMAQVMIGADTPEKQQLFGLLGAGMQYGVIMPFGRAQESEADEIGLRLMARAGFDPRQAISLWENMARAAAGPQPPEILSTHPSHGTRIARQTAAMPEALQLYATARAAGRRPSCR